MWDKVYIKKCNAGRGVFARKDIKKGQEIRFDYSATMDKDYWVMKYKYSSENRRKIIKDFKYLSSNLKQGYLKLSIVQNFITEKFKSKLPLSKL